jgi:hypothetical protein
MARARAAPVLAHAGMFIPAGRGRAPETTQALKAAKPAIAAAGQARNAASNRGDNQGPWPRAIDTKEAMTASETGHVTGTRHSSMAHAL